MSHALPPPLPRSSRPADAVLYAVAVITVLLSVVGFVRAVSYADHERFSLLLVAAAAGRDSIAGRASAGVEPYEPTLTAYSMQDAGDPYLAGSQDRVLPPEWLGVRAVVDAGAIIYDTVYAFPTERFVEVARRHQRVSGLGSETEHAILLTCERDGRMALRLHTTDELDEVLALYRARPKATTR